MAREDWTRARMSTERLPSSRPWSRSRAWRWAVPTIASRIPTERSDSSTAPTTSTTARPSASSTKPPPSTPAAASASSTSPARNSEATCGASGSPSGAPPQAQHRRHPRLARPRRRPGPPRPRRRRHRHRPQGPRQRPQAPPRPRLRRGPHRRRRRRGSAAAPHRVATVLHHRPQAARHPHQQPQGHRRPRHPHHRPVARSRLDDPSPRPPLKRTALTAPGTLRDTFRQEEAASGPICTTGPLAAARTTSAARPGSAGPRCTGQPRSSPSGTPGDTRGPAAAVGGPLTVRGGAERTARIREGRGARGLPAFAWLGCYLSTPAPVVVASDAGRLAAEVSRPVVRAGVQLTVVFRSLDEAAL